MKQIHGNLVEIDGAGLMITGDHGTGKTRLTIELVKKGGRFVADDAVILECRGHDVVGSAAELTAGLIAVGGQIKSFAKQFPLAQVAKETVITYHLDLDDATFGPYAR